MLKAILFDLDGTLLNLDFDTFLQSYFASLSQAFKDVLPSDKFIRALWASTEVMVANPGHTTNQEVFIRDFTTRVNRPAEELVPRFDRFYRDEFPRLHNGSMPNPASRRIVELAKKNGLDVVVATNPVFPLEAILTRLGWAGLADVDFKLITSYEHMHACKPHVRYYEEVLANIGRNPEECLMVGNDVEEDLPAGRLGIDTYLATDCLIDRGSGLKADYRGPFSDLYRVLVDRYGLKE